MTIRKEYVFIAVAIIALSAYLIFKKSDRTGYQMPTMATLASSDITKMEMARQSGTITLEKTDGQWIIQPGGFPANMDKVTSMLQALEKLSLTTLVSESGSLDRYELGDSQKIHVRAWAGADLKRDFDLGKVAPTYQHTFVRLPDKPQVYHALDNLRSRFEETVDGLRNKIVLSFNPSDVTEFAITSGETVLKLVKTEIQQESKPNGAGQAEPAKDGSEKPTDTEPVWQTEQNQKADSAQVDRVLGTLSTLRCDGFVNDKKPEDYAKPVLTIRLKGKTEPTLSVFEKSKSDDKTYPAVSSESPYVFLLADRQVDMLKDSSGKLIPK